MDARYDQVAESYGTDLGVDPPALTALLDRCGDVNGERVLDLACGHGVAARRLAAAGAHVDAADVSASLLDRAHQMERDQPLGITYHHLDVTRSAAFFDGHFDLIVCNFGLSDIDDLDDVLANVHRWLQPGGRFIASLLHPCFGGGDDVSASWPTDQTYYDEGSWRADGTRSLLRRVVGANHRTLSTYLNSLVAHGLVPEAFDEPRPEPDWTTSRPMARRQPVYLVITARRS